MASFHVFVEGATDRSPHGLRKLADAMAAKYGVPAADLLARLAGGRFRVKTNTDAATAKQYVADLQAIGARCVIEEASADNSRATPPPFAAATPPGGYQSGLSAAFSGQTPAASLGALERQDGGGFALASVDGGDAAAAEPSGSFAPPSDAPVAKPTPKPARPKDVPVDLFVPPDAGVDELKVELADDEVERSARKRASTPPASAPVVAAPPPTPARRSQPVIEERPTSKHPLGDPRVRFAAGVALALAVGFVPAHVVAGMREKSAYAAIDRQIIATQEQADTPDAYAALDAFRDDRLARKKSDRQNIALMALAIWAAIGGGVAYVWFRRIPWQRFEG